MPPQTPQRKRHAIAPDAPFGSKVRATSGAVASARKRAPAGLTLLDLVRRSVSRTRTWTVAHAEVERERTRQVARVGNNLNQIARWANTHRGAIEAVEVIGHLIAIRRALAALSPAEGPDGDAG